MPLKPYSPDAGFAKARSAPRQPLVVHALFDVPVLRRGLNYWNDRAGRLLFALDGDGLVSPDITVEDATDYGRSYAAMVGPDGQNNEDQPAAYPYIRAVIGIHPDDVNDWTVPAHEAGHTLGFDHAFGAYVGIMSAEPPSDEGRKQDKEGLVRYGYRGSADSTEEKS